MICHHGDLPACPREALLGRRGYFHKKIYCIHRAGKMDVKAAYGSRSQSADLSTAKNLRMFRDVVSILLPSAHEHAENIEHELYTLPQPAEPREPSAPAPPTPPTHHNVGDDLSPIYEEDEQES